MMNRRIFTSGLLFGSVGFSTLSCSAPSNAVRPRRDLYNCEGCDVVFERAKAKLGATLQLAEAGEPGERMWLSGTIFQSDGVTPARDVILYAHHTNNDGLYAHGTNENEWSRRHGRLRGWVRTGADGRYAFDTVKPAPYPDRTMPAHVHLYIGEPGRRSYYVDDAVFAGEFRVDADYIARQELRGGSGIVPAVKDAQGVWQVRRDIILEPHPV